MMAAHRLKGMGWFVCGVIVALGFYLVSLQVAGERKRLEDINHSIIQAQRDIRDLETEFDARSNLAQLERWNGDALALSAPTAGQYLVSEGQLASLGAGGMPQVQMAALVTPTAPVQQIQPQMVAATAAPAPAPQAAEPARAVVMPAVMTAVPIRPQLQRTAFHPAQTPAKAQAMAMLDRHLLSDSTLGDLASGARSEAASYR